jgi:Putative transposase
VIVAEIKSFDDGGHMRPRIFLRDMRQGCGPPVNRHRPFAFDSRLLRRLFLERLTAAYQAGRLHFFTNQAALAEPAAFQARLAALRKRKWVVYAKRPFGGPDAVLAYLSRYTHRIAIANSRLVAFGSARSPAIPTRDRKIKSKAGAKSP